MNSNAAIEANDGGSTRLLWVANFESYDPKRRSPRKGSVFSHFKSDGAWICQSGAMINVTFDGEIVEDDLVRLTSQPAVNPLEAEPFAYCAERISKHLPFEAKVVSARQIRESGGFYVRTYTDFDGIEELMLLTGYLFLGYEPSPHRLIYQEERQEILAIIDSIRRRAP